MIFCCLKMINDYQIPAEFFARKSILLQARCCNRVISFAKNKKNPRGFQAVKPQCTVYMLSVKEGIHLVHRSSRQVYQLLFFCLVNSCDLLLLCRICGYQLLNSKDDGTQLIPYPAGDTRIFGQRPQTSVLEDVEEFGAFDSQGCVS